MSGSAQLAAQGRENLFGNAEIVAGSRRPFIKIGNGLAACFVAYLYIPHNVVSSEMTIRVRVEARLRPPGGSTMTSLR